MKSYHVIIFYFLISVALNVSAGTEPPLDQHLEFLRPLLGKTWKGEFKGSTPEKPMIDIARWERALNGKAVRIVHSLNAGLYGGESIIIWDDAAHAVIYYYFTTAGFMTKGTITNRQAKIITHEVISGAAGGVTEVRGQTELRTDGTIFVKTEHLKDSVWTPGRETTYREDPSALAIFK
jgi:hypothetical protein